MDWIIKGIVGLSVLGMAASQCTFPGNFSGTWRTNIEGNWLINGSHILDFKLRSLTTGNRVNPSVDTVSFECYENRGDTKYLVKSNQVEIFGGTFGSLYACLDIEFTSTKLVYYHVAAQDANGFVFTFENNDYNTLCGTANYKLPYNFFVGVKQGSESLATSLCPDDMFGTYYYNTCNDTTSTNTTMDVCATRTQMIFDLTMCDTDQLFTREGTVNCVYFTTSGSRSYLMTYNPDSTNPDGVTYFRFTCVVTEIINSNLTLTANPDRCNTDQTSTQIASPGIAMQLSSYYLCPLTTTAAPTTTTAAPPLDIWPIVVGVLAGLLVIGAIIAIIICCCLRKRRKKEEDEESIKSESSDESRPQSRIDEEAERSSLDSGISEPPPTTDRTDNSNKDLDDHKVTELVIVDEGEKDYDDKTSRPRTGQMSRMSDLPPSELPDDDAETHRSEEEPKGDDDEPPIDENPPIDEEDEDKEEPGEETKSEKEDDAKSDEEKPEESDKESEKEDEKEPSSDEEKNRNASPKPGEGKDSRASSRASQAKDSDLSSDEEQRRLNRIGGRRGRHFNPTGALTTVLVSRDDDEKKKQKQEKKKSKSKDRNVKRFFKRKFGKIGSKGGKKGGKGGKHGDDPDEYGSSDEEGKKFGGPRGAPFMKQYENKKRLEHVLDEQHYWSDPEGDKDGLGIRDNISSVFSNSDSSDSEMEIIGPDGVPIKVKKPKRKKGRGDGDDISNADSEYLRMKMLKRAGSVDTLASVEDPNGFDHRRSKRKLNEHNLTSDRSGVDGDNGKNGEDGEDVEYERDDDGNLIPRKRGKGGKLEKDAHGNTILVKEHSGSSLDDDEKRRQEQKKKGKSKYGTTEGDLFGDFDSDIEKLSDRDSGMDEDEEDVDVTLNNDQQQMVVNMLFDEDMNLRPQFYRNEDGKIVRRLDDSVIYDPKTGRFTYRKRLGQLFKVPRLRRNDKGRPTGGFIEDEYGPKQSELMRKRSSSAKFRRTRSGRSEREVNSAGTTKSKSTDMKRSRGEGRKIGFDVPDEDLDYTLDEDPEFNKRGRRAGSALRRKLNKRLFRKKRKGGRPGDYPEPIGNAWGEHAYMNGSAKLGPGGLSPINARYGRGQGGAQQTGGSPWQGRRGMGGQGGDSTQWQKYREGLQSDRRILENLQDKMNSTGAKPLGSNMNGTGNEGDENGEFHYQPSQFAEGHPHHLHSHSYYSDDGKLVIRERGCPELKPKPLFTKVRRPGELQQIDERGQGQDNRMVKSAPMQLQDYNGDQHEQEERPGNTQRVVSENSLVAHSMDGSQMTSIDDNRLRRLLEEMYKDKRYLDNYIESMEDKSEAIVHSKGLAEHGRGYLLQRADYWDRRGPLPPRPPCMTEIGFKMHQQQLNSRLNSEMGSSTLTYTPDLFNHSNVPGVVESPIEEEQKEQEPQTNGVTVNGTHTPLESVA